jgi:uridine phosphorylase
VPILPPAASFLRARGFSKLAYGSQGDGTQQVYDDPNFPKTGDGRVLHLNAKAGDIANRIVTVGDPERAKRLLQYLDKPDEATCLETGRGFVIYNGTVRAKP